MSSTLTKAGLSLVLFTVLGQQDPCTHYQDINEPLRSVGYVAGRSDYDHYICDRLLTVDWYRFTSVAGEDIKEEENKNKGK